MQDALERAARALSCKREEIGERLEKLIASREDAEKRLRALMRKGADSLAKELAAKGSKPNSAFRSSRRLRKSKASS